MSDLTITEFRRGFGQVYRRLWRENDLPPHDRMIVANMLERLGQNASIWPSQATIAEDLGISPRSVWSGLKRLQERGWVTVKRRGQGKTAVYNLDIVAIVKWANAPKNRNTRESHDSQPVRPRVATRAIQGSHQTRREDPSVEEPSEEDPPLEMRGDSADATRVVSKVLKSLPNRPLTEDDVDRFKARWPGRPVEEDVAYWRGHIGFRTAADKPAFVERKLAERYESAQNARGRAALAAVNGAGTSAPAGRRFEV